MEIMGMHLLYNVIVCELKLNCSLQVFILSAM